MYAKSKYWKTALTARFALLLLAVLIGLLAARPALAQTDPPSTGAVGAMTDDEAAPGPPVTLVATAGNGTVTLAWTAPDSDGSSPVTGYEYQQREGEGEFGAWTATDNSLATYQVVTGLTNGVRYTFRVRALSAAGETGASDEASAEPSDDFRPVITAASTRAEATVFFVTITFDRDVSDLSRHALVVHGGRTVAHAEPWGPRLSRPNGRQWIAHIQPDIGFTGTLTIDIPAGAVRDANDNPSLAAVQYTRTIKEEHVRPRLYLDLAPVEGTNRYRDPRQPVSGPFTVRIQFVTDHVFHQPVTGLTVDEVTITNGVKSNFRQITEDRDGYPGDYEVTVTPDPTYTGPFTVAIEEGAAYACDDITSTATCDPTNLILGDTLPLSVVAPE